MIHNVSDDSRRGRQVWREVTPGVGDIVRMWQPFNGLQVFATPPKYAVDAADFPEVRAPTVYANWESHGGLPDR